jgi:hypothetical protein
VVGTDVPIFSATEQPLHTHQEMTQQLENKGNEVVNEDSVKTVTVKRIMG